MVTSISRRTTTRMPTGITVEYSDPLIQLTEQPIQLANGKYAYVYAHKSRLKYLKPLKVKGKPVQTRVLEWLRDHVDRDIPRRWYTLVLGHDLHISTYAELHIRHYHSTDPDPYHPGLIGWVEDIGLVSRNKVTVEFRDFETDQLQTETSAYGDFKFHRPGTDATAEANSQTGLIVDAGLEATGSQTESAANVYVSVATVTADGTETWQEHSIANATGAGGGTLMDRSLISPTVSVVNLDTVEFTYSLTKNAEA